MATELFCTVSRPADTDYATLPSLFSTSLAEWMGYRKKQKGKKNEKRKKTKGKSEFVSLRQNQQQGQFLSVHYSNLSATSLHFFLLNRPISYI